MSPSPNDKLARATLGDAGGEHPARRCARCGARAEVERVVRTRRNMLVHYRCACGARFATEPGSLGVMNFAGGAFVVGIGLTMLVVLRHEFPVVGAALVALGLIMLASPVRLFIVDRRNPPLR